MALIYFYDVHEDEKKVLEPLLSEHVCTFYEEPIHSHIIHSDAEIISIFVSSTITEEFLEKMPNLKMIACRSAGFNNVPIHRAHEKGITVVTVPSYGEHTVAEYTFSLMLALTRMIPETIKPVKEGSCLVPITVRGIDINEKTLGVIGTGKIGKHVIEIAKGFGMHVLAYDPYEDKEAQVNLGFQYAPLETLCKESDIITLHSPLTDSNHHLLSASLFSLMKDGVYIINTARGELIDTKALLVALDTNRVAGCALDVVEGEELLKEHCKITNINEKRSHTILEESFYISSLLSHPRVILTPHLAYNTKEAVTRILTTTAHNILSFLAGSPEHVIAPTKKPYGKLILVRHTESEWNKAGIWTGTRDVKLSLKGFEDARLLGETLQDIHIDKAYASLQIRTMETLSSMLGAMQQLVVPIERNSALNERDYGDYTGKNKHEMKTLLGDELFEKTRRGWDVYIPNGETLSDVYDRIVPYYLDTILPHLAQGETVLIVSHGNALRALIKYIESISNEGIEKTEMMFGGALIYSIDEQGKKVDKETRETKALYFDTHF